MGERMDRLNEAGGREKRRFSRLPRRLPLHYKIINESTSAQDDRSVTTCDIARNGLRFNTPDALHVGDCLALQLILPGRGQAIAALAKVLRVTPLDADSPRTPGPLEVGVCFLWSGWHDGKMQRQISDFVREELDILEAESHSFPDPALNP